MNELELCYRLVDKNQMRRFNVFRRVDGLFFYTLDKISEWDDSPPIWVEIEKSGLFSDADIARIEGLQTGSWLNQADSEGLIGHRDNPIWRPLGVSERRLLDWLLSNGSPTDLRGGYEHLLVTNIDPNRGLQFRSDAPESDRSPKLIAVGSYRDGIDKTGSFVRLALYCKDQRLHQLTIEKTDHSPILIDPYEIDPGEINVELGF